MKALWAVLVVLIVIMGMGIYMVVQKVQETPYQCSVLTVDADGNKTYRDGKFTQDQLDAISEHGGGMLGSHVEMMQENDSGDYISPILKQEESFGGAVVCKKSVSI